MTIEIIDVCRAAERMARSVVLTPLAETQTYITAEDPTDTCVVQYIGLERLDMMPLILINETLLWQWAEDEGRNGGGYFANVMRTRDFDGIKLWGYPVRVVSCDRETPAKYEIHITTNRGNWSFRR